MHDRLILQLHVVTFYYKFTLHKYQNIIYVLFVFDLESNQKE